MILLCRNNNGLQRLGRLLTSVPGRVTELQSQGTSCLTRRTT
jgi:hypothetical protein